MSLKEFTLQLAYKAELERELIKSPDKRNNKLITALNTLLTC